MSYIRISAKSESQNFNSCNLRRDFPAQHVWAQVPNLTRGQKPLIPVHHLPTQHCSTKVDLKLPRNPISSILFDLCKFYLANECVPRKCFE